MIGKITLAFLVAIFGLAFGNGNTSTAGTMMTQASTAGGDTFKKGWDAVKQGWAAIEQKFVGMYHSIADFTAQNKDEAAKKYNDMTTYINDMYENRDMLMEGAKNESNLKVQEAVGKLSQWKQDLENMKSKLGTDDVVKGWSDWIKKTYDSGLADMIELNRKLNDGESKNVEPTSGAFSVVVNLIYVWLSVALATVFRSV